LCKAFAQVPDVLIELGSLEQLDQEVPADAQMRIGKIPGQFG
jgi:hypothetical protein